MKKKITASQSAGGVRKDLESHDILFSKVNSNPLPATAKRKCLLLFLCEKDIDQHASLYVQGVCDLNGCLMWFGHCSFLCDRFSQTWWIKTTEIYSPAVLGEICVIRAVRGLSGASRGYWSLSFPAFGGCQPCLVVTLLQVPSLWIHCLPLFCLYETPLCFSKDTCDCI